MLQMIISGGQTGVDRIGLVVAKKVGFLTGGFAPKGYKTERGFEKEVLEGFRLEETEQSDYSFRTFLNIERSEGTVVFGDINSTGTKLTIMNALILKKPIICNPNENELETFISNNKINVLNVAGNRGSKLSKDKKKEIATVLFNTLTKIKKEYGTV